LAASRRQALRRELEAARQTLAELSVPAAEYQALKVDGYATSLEDLSVVRAVEDVEELRLRQQDLGVLAVQAALATAVAPIPIGH
jgi:hypothetical protein